MAQSEGSEPRAETGRDAGSEPASAPGGDGLGKLFFAITLIATLAFFWWLLIYDHGVVSAH